MTTRPRCGGHIPPPRSLPREAADGPAGAAAAGGDGRPSFLFAGRETEQHHQTVSNDSFFLVASSPAAATGDVPPSPAVAQHTRQFSSDDRFFEGIHDSGLSSLSFEQRRGRGSRRSAGRWRQSCSGGGGGKR